MKYKKHAPQLKTLRILCIFICFFAEIPLVAQQARVAVYRVQAENTPEQLTEVINEVIFSFTKEIKDYTIIDLHTEPLPDDPQNIPVSDYVFYGRLVSFQDSIQLTVILQDRHSNVTRTIKKNYPSSNKLLLESRMLVRDAFLQLGEAETVSEVSPSGESQDSEAWLPVSNLNALTGTWTADPSIERVVFLRGGRGIAVFTTGVSVPLDLSIEEGYLIVQQRGTPVARQFVDLPEPLAQKAAFLVSPLKWSFLVSSDNEVLFGTKYDSIVKNNGTEITSIEDTQVPAVWYKNQR